MVLTPILGLAALAACSVPTHHAPPPLELALWPAPATSAETTRRGDDLVAGAPWTEVHDVSRPTITVYPPHGENTGAAVVVFGLLSFWFGGLSRSAQPAAPAAPPAV